MNTVVKTKIAINPTQAKALAAKAAAAKAKLTVKTKATATAKPGVVNATAEISDARLLQLMRDPNFTNVFPILATARAQIAGKKVGCGRCGRKNRRTSTDLNAVKQSLANMPLAQKAQFRSMLHARQVVIRYVKANGQGTKLMF